MEWRKGRVLEGTLEVPRAALLGAADAQWLCSPWECPFTLSLHGDLRPLGGMEPRHPRGRIEFYAAGGTPVWDTLAQIQAKFEDAAAFDRFCIERSTLQRLQRLRALPPKRDTVRMVRRIVQAWMRHYDDESGEPQQQQRALKWPQVPPSFEVTNGGLNAEWNNARDLLLRKLPPTMRPLVESALRPLQVEEGEALFNLPPHSQWAIWDRRQGQLKRPLAAEREVALPSQDAVEQNAHAEQLRTQLLGRLETLKAAMGKGLIRWPRSTHGNARVTLVEEHDHAAA